MNLSDELQQAVAESGARLRFRFPAWLRPFVFRGITAITIGRRVYVRAPAEPDGLERLLRHEIGHVRQINRIGLIRFYVRYGAEYVRNRRAGMTSWDAYRAISFEREAAVAEDVHPDLDV